MYYVVLENGLYEIIVFLFIYMYKTFLYLLNVKHIFIYWMYSIFFDFNLYI